MVMVKMFHCGEFSRIEPALIDVYLFSPERTSLVVWI